MGRAIVRPFRDVWPRIDASVWIAPGAAVVGDVAIGSDSSVWYGATIRADVNAIRVGARSNLQDQCVIHVTRARFDCELGDEVTIGHRAVVHGCRVSDGALVGIGAIVLDGARVGEEALVAAGAVVAPGFEVPDGALALGVPARVSRVLSAEERALQRRRALEYVGTAREHASVEAR
jgi:carbonic anhydrase/acetyltransferase-like protein (isoleucine patch superfamily)